MRKAPRQQRSRAMVETIVEAATRVLGRKGWADFTTNEVAAVAGVSVGSLYQYFPNKLALVEAIRDQHRAAILAALPAIDDKAVPTTLTQRAQQLIAGVIAEHLVDPALHRVLIDEVPPSARSSQDAFEIEYQRRYLAVVTASGAGHDSERDRMAGRVLSSAIEGVVHAAARNGELDVPGLKQELELLVCAYLRGRGEPA